MYDKQRRAPDTHRLFMTADAHAGYVTAAEAHACGYSKQLVAHGVAAGRFIRVRRGLYRLRDYPSSPHEAEIIAWLSVGPATAVISHESALNLLDLSDVLPDRVHVSVPRQRRGLRVPPGVILHTRTQPLTPAEVMEWDGVRLTAPARSIVDAAEYGTSPDQIVRAIEHALERGLLTGARLRQAAAGRSRRVATLIDQTVSGV